MTRLTAGAVALLATLFGSASAQAQVADLTRASCAQLLDLPSNDRGQLIVWLHGYYAGAAQRAVIDRSKLEAAKAMIEQACKRSRAMALIGLEVRAIFLGEPLPQTPPTSSPPAGPGQNFGLGPMPAR